MDQQQNQLQTISDLISFEFGANSVRVYGTTEEPLFVANDVGKILGIKDFRTSKLNLDEDDVIPDVDINTVDKNGVTQRRRVDMLTEYGLYELLFISRKAIAKTFRKQIKILLHNLRTNKIQICNNEKLQLQQQNNQQIAIIQKQDEENAKLQEENQRLKKGQYMYTYYTMTDKHTGHVFYGRTRNDAMEQVNKSIGLAVRQFQSCHTLFNSHMFNMIKQHVNNYGVLKSYELCKQLKEQFYIEINEECIAHTNNESLRYIKQQIKLGNPNLVLNSINEFKVPKSDKYKDLHEAWQDEI